MATVSRLKRQKNNSMFVYLHSVQSSIVQEAEFIWYFAASPPPTGGEEDLLPETPARSIHRGRDSSALLRRPGGRHQVSTFQTGESTSWCLGIWRKFHFDIEVTDLLDKENRKDDGEDDPEDLAAMKGYFLHVGKYKRKNIYPQHSTTYSSEMSTMPS